MIRLIAMTVLSGSVFTMCDGGPVPVGCCEPGDRLDVIVGVGNYQRCADLGGVLVIDVCQGVDK